MCLADLCPAFGCSYSSHHSAFEGGDHFVEFSPYYYSDSGGIQDHAPDPNDKKKFERVTPCTNSEVQNNRKACGEIFERFGGVIHFYFVSCHDLCVWSVVFMTSR